MPSLHIAEEAVQSRELRNSSPLPTVIEKGRQSQLPPSPVESVLLENGVMANSSTLEVEEEHLMRHLDRGAPGDQAIASETKTPEQKVLAKRRSQFYGDVFASRESNSSARERISKESIILADVRTNVIVDDEYTFITDLSNNLSARYQRPESSILVTVLHSACLLFSGSFDPAYILTITGLPSQLQPVTNKRNAALLGKCMEQSLGVGPDRGLIKFVPISEENLATNGKTVAGEIEDLERGNSEDNANLKRSMSRGTPKSKKRQSTMSMLNLKLGTQLSTHDELMSSPPTSEPESPPLPAEPKEKSAMDKKADKIQKMSRRKSFIAAVFGK